MKEFLEKKIFRNYKKMKNGKQIYKILYKFLL